MVVEESEEEGKLIEIGYSQVWYPAEAFDMNYEEAPSVIMVNHNFCNNDWH